MNFKLSTRPHILSICLIAAFLFATLPLMAKGPSQADDTVEVQGIGTAFVVAWNEHDMTALANLFTTDADFINVVGMWWRGRDAIREAHEQTHKTIFKASHLVLDSARVKFLAPDIAVAHMTWTLTGHLSPDGQPGSPRRGILTFVAQRQEQGWLVQSAQNTDIVPGALIPPVGQVSGK
jgi:uncharacterized protein (TIGR02246 family)